MPFKYPRAGHANANVDLGVVARDGRRAALADVGSREVPVPRARELAGEHGAADDRRAVARADRPRRDRRRSRSDTAARHRARRRVAQRCDRRRAASWLADGCRRSCGRPSRAARWTLELRDADGSSSSVLDDARVRAARRSLGVDGDGARSSRRRRADAQRRLARAARRRRAVAVDRRRRRASTRRSRATA